MWMVRAGRGGENVEEFVEASVVAFADSRLGAIPPGMTKDVLLRLYAEKYPEAKEGSRESWASQLLRFIQEVRPGDGVVTFNRAARRYVIGKIAGDYAFRSDTVTAAHSRAVTWTGEVSRDRLLVATRNTLGSTLTIFKLGPDAARDLIENARPIGAAPTASAPALTPSREDDTMAVLSDDTIERANEFIEDLIDGLDWEDMQHLVAGVLRAMGYRTTVAEPGPDRGVDIFASPDGLGLEEPRIFVEVKHRSQQMTAKEIRAFVGGRRKGDKCLYVSTGGFAKDAHYEADRAEVALQLLNLPKLRQLVVDHYEKLDAETRALVPLRRLYWPMAKSGN